MCLVSTSLAATTISDGSGDGGKADPCWSAARSMLDEGSLHRLEQEAQNWRQHLGRSMESYYNVQQKAWLAHNPTAQKQLESMFQTDFHPRPNSTGNAVHDQDYMSTSKLEAYTRDRFNFFLPKDVAESTPTLCRHKLLLGDKRHFRESVDGYQACGLDVMASSQHGGECIVYSLGSNNVFHFERAVVTKTNCTVHTFDCTSAPPLRSPQGNPRFHFHPICVGQSKAGSELTFKPLPAIMAELGHAHISIIKWDVEGFEHDIFRDLLQDGNLQSRLPREILFELHFRSHMGARTSWWDREKSAGEMAMLGVDLYDAGYRVIAAHRNAGCSSCYEYSLLRVSCPRSKRADS